MSGLGDRSIILVGERSRADKAATWGQNGGSKNVENLQECMEWLLASTQNAATAADTDDTEY